MLWHSLHACLPLIVFLWGGAGGGGEGGVPPPPQSVRFLRPGAAGRGNRDTAPLWSLSAAPCCCVYFAAPFNELGQVAWAGGNPVRIINCDFAGGWADIFDANADLGNCFCYSSLPPTLLGGLRLPELCNHCFHERDPSPSTDAAPRPWVWTGRRTWGLSGHDGIDVFRCSQF